jgi:hypothetical protein
MLSLKIHLHLAVGTALAFVHAGGYQLAQSPPVVWTVPSLQRVGPNDPAGNGTQVQLWAARGEYESFQIITRAPGSGNLTKVNVSASDLIGPSGGIISQSNITLYREYYVYIGSNSGSTNWHGSNQPLGPGWYPDALIPLVGPSASSGSAAALMAVPYNLSAGTNQPIWVDIFVPRTAVPGQYVGSYTVRSDQGAISGQMVLNVWNFTLPLQPSLASSFGVWNSDHFAIDVELLRHRLMPDSVDQLQEGALITSYGLWAVNLGFSSGASYSNCRMTPPPSLTAVQNSVAAQNSVAGHQSGLLLYDYSADEIDNCTNLFPSLKQWARVLHAANIKNLVTMGPTPELFDDGSGAGRSAVDIWAVLPDTYNTDIANIQLALQKGDQVWSYNTEVQDAYSPKWEIDFAPINFRIQPGFINQSLNLTGLLYWRVDRWSSDPWNEVVMTDSGSTFPGEAELVYPGPTAGIVGVVPSMRLKWLRDGVDDYDYIQLLKRAGYGDWAIQIAKGVAPDWRNWVRDPKTLEKARLKLGRMLNDLGK